MSEFRVHHQVSELIKILPLHWAKIDGTEMYVAN